MPTRGDTRSLDTDGGTDPHALVAELRRQIDTERQGRETAEVRAHQLAGEVAEQRERVGRAEGEATALREQVAVERSRAEASARRWRGRGGPS